MSLLFINGYKKPAFIVHKSSSLAERFDLSFKYNGLKEYWEEKFIEHESIGGKITQEFISLRKYFELDYSGIIQKEDSLKIQEILNAAYAGKTIIIIPHTDNESYRYQVAVEPGQKTLSLHYGGRCALGNKDLVITFKTVSPLSNLGWQDTENLQINLTNLKIK